MLRQHYGGHELADCWPRHIHAVWELPTLAADGIAPSVAHALTWPGPRSSHDRWLPITLRRITGMTRACLPQCATLRRSW